MPESTTVQGCQNQTLEAFDGTKCHAHKIRKHLLRMEKDFNIIVTLQASVLYLYQVHTRFIVHHCFTQYVIHHAVLGLQLLIIINDISV